MTNDTPVSVRVATSSGRVINLLQDGMPTPSSAVAGSVFSTAAAVLSQPVPNAASTVGISSTTSNTPAISPVPAAPAPVAAGSPEATTVSGTVGSNADYWRSGGALLTKTLGNPNVSTATTSTLTATTAYTPSSSSILGRSSTGITTSSAVPTPGTATASSPNSTTGDNMVSVRPPEPLTMKRTGGTFLSRASSFSTSRRAGTSIAPLRLPNSTVSTSLSGLGTASSSATPNLGASPVPSQPSRLSLASHPSIQALQGQWGNSSPKRIPGINAEREADNRGSANNESTSRPHEDSIVPLKRHAKSPTQPAPKRHQFTLVDEEEDSDVESGDLNPSTHNQDRKNLKEKTTIPSKSKSLSVYPNPVSFDFDARIIWTKDKTRYYTHFYDETGNLVKQWGALFPTYYRPGIGGYGNGHGALWICPVRTCRKRLTTIKGLCGHFNASHASQILNDNLDGTFSILGENRAPLPEEKTKPAIVVSQNPRDPDEPIPHPSLLTAAKDKTNEPKMQVQSLPYQHSHRSSEQRWLQHPLQRQLTRLDKGVEDSGPGRPANVGKPERLGRPPSRSPGGNSSNSSLNPMAVVPLRPSLASRIRKEVPPPRPVATPEQPSSSSLTRQTVEESVIDNSLLGAPDHNTMSMHDKPDTRAETVNGRLPNNVGSSRAPTPMGEDRAGGSELAASDSSRNSPGIVISTSFPAATDGVPMVEMEAWEIAPGRLRPTENGGNIAYSSAYLNSNKSIPVAKDVSFNVLTLKPGQSLTLEPNKMQLRICSIATGKIKVATRGLDFFIGPGGMFKIAPVMDCTLTNRLYIDSTLHITSIDLES